MIRLFLRALISAFSIIGGVVGAGFITGKEIQIFFSNDFSIAGLYLTFICFIFSLLLIMTFKFGKFGKKVIGTYISCANIFIAGCMFSALEKVYSSIFSIMENILILQIITAILVFIISARGIDSIGKLNFVLIPVVMLVIFVFGAISIKEINVKLSPKTLMGSINPIIYVGFNVVLSFAVIKNSGKKLFPPFKVISCIITAFFLCGCICIISLAIKNCSLSLDMPFVSIFEQNVKLLIIVDIISLFAILTTYVSSMYSAFDFGEKKLKVHVKILIFLTSIAISNLGFSSIVDTVYPIIGAVGFLLLLIICLLSTVFLKAQPKRTLPPPKGRE